MEINSSLCYNLFQMSLNFFLSDEILNRYGPVTRARQCYLYTKKNVRLLDLYQLGGKAILGWGGSKSGTVFKNVFNRGVSGFFPTEFDDRINKAVSTLLNSERKCFIYSNKTQALKASLTLCPEDTTSYRPWSPETINWSEKQCVILEPVFPWAQNIYIVAAKPEILELALIAGKTIEQPSFIPAPLQAAIAKSFFELIKEIPLRQEKNWFIYDKIISKYWIRKGPWLFPKVPEEKYKDFISHCLDCQLVISPDYNVPSVIPFGADTGNFTKLKNSPFEF